MGRGLPPCIWPPLCAAINYSHTRVTNVFFVKKNNFSTGLSLVSNNRTKRHIIRVIWRLLPPYAVLDALTNQQVDTILFVFNTELRSPVIYCFSGFGLVLNKDARENLQKKISPLTVNTRCILCRMCTSVCYYARRTKTYTTNLPKRIMAVVARR